jgi:CRP-like cAMP-binding protein
VDTPNLLLGRVPQAERQQVFGALQRVDLCRGDILSERNQRVTHVWFPETCVISAVSVFEDGQTAEMTATGREGVAPISIIFGSDRAMSRLVVQVPGKCLRLTATAFLGALEALPSFRETITRFGHALIGQVLQSVACNGVHTAQERCARWILMAQDRTGMDTFPLTQEHLADLVAVSRVKVSLVARTLQAAGLIRYSRGSVSVLDRQGLEEASCECYEIITNIYEQRLGKLASK